MGYYEDEDFVRFEPHLCDWCLKSVSEKLDARLRIKHPEWFTPRSLKKTGLLNVRDVKAKFQKDFYEYRKKVFDKNTRMCVVVSIEGSYNTYCSRHLREFNKWLMARMKLQEERLKSW
jgi:hypothetical protein